MNEIKSSTLAADNPMATALSGVAASRPASVSVLDSLAECAASAGITLAGLLLRVGWQSVRLAPRLLKGNTPRMIKMNFLPLAALQQVLAQRMDPVTAAWAVEEVLFTATMAETVANFMPVMFNPGMDTIASQIHKVYSGPGKHQKIVYEIQTPAHFQFVINDCVFVRAMDELGIKNISHKMCEADRHFWKNVVRGTGIRFTKEDPTIARGGACCQIRFDSEN